ncbi:lysozyme inhibitor LprI family protein [Inhella proteolytica]|uniref:Lysozyme inhibitor LprI N-terminal domain-containing protein n=1 Tax=Inhella proteolytica TaxID=2795029 RepID=A0A931NJ59_9BURK|nr:hypothetical protein [Inhella proteolytica]MBH9578300.1 hypothetical protein [Inhella proteolytica]
MKALTFTLPIAAQGAAQAASFDCRKAQLPVERRLCANPELSALDEAVAAAFRAAQQQSIDTDPLRLDQQRWLRQQRNPCADDACLARVQRERLAQLQGWQAAAPWPADAAGHYLMPRRIQVLDVERQQWVSSAAADCLSLQPRPDGRWQLAVELVQANAHTCTLEGAAERVGEALELRPAESVLPDRPCRLRLRFKAHSLVLEDPEGHCRAQFCGVRAGFEGVEFLRRERAPAGAARCGAGE